MRLLCTLVAAVVLAVVADAGIYSYSYTNRPTDLNSPAAHPITLQHGSLTLYELRFLSTTSPVPMSGEVLWTLTEPTIGYNVVSWSGTVTSSNDARFLVAVRPRADEVDAGSYQARMYVIGTATNLVAYDDVTVVGVSNAGSGSVTLNVYSTNVVNMAGVTRVSKLTGDVEIVSAGWGITWTTNGQTLIASNTVPPPPTNLLVQLLVTNGVPFWGTIGFPPINFQVATTILFSSVNGMTQLHTFAANTTNRCRVHLWGGGAPGYGSVGGAGTHAWAQFKPQAGQTYRFYLPPPAPFGSVALTQSWAFALAGGDGTNNTSTRTADGGPAAGFSVNGDTNWILVAGGGGAGCEAAGVQGGSGSGGGPSSVALGGMAGGTPTATNTLQAYGARADNIYGVNAVAGTNSVSGTNVITQANGTWARGGNAYQGTTNLIVDLGGGGGGFPLGGAGAASFGGGTARGSGSGGLSFADSNVVDYAFASRSATNGVPADTDHPGYTPGAAIGTIQAYGGITCGALEIGAND